MTALLIAASLALWASDVAPTTRERIAVLIIPADTVDRALADNLTEVAIARLAETSDYELVGTRELRRKLALDGAAELPGDCLSDNACLGRVAILVGVRRLVSGSVRPEGGGFLLALALNDIESGKVERTFFRAVSGDLPVLIRAVQDGVNELFLYRPAASQLRVDSVPDGATVIVDERVRGTTPVWVNPLEPGNHRLRVEMAGHFPWKQELALAPGQNLLVTVNRDQLVARRRWVPYAAYGSGALAIASFAAAAVFGTLARADLTGGTRAEVQQDLDIKRGYAALTNVLIGAGIALAGVSAFTFVRYRQDIAVE